MLFYTLSAYWLTFGSKGLKIREILELNSIMAVLVKNTPVCQIFFTLVLRLGGVSITETLKNIVEIAL